MARRQQLTEAQLSELFDPPTEQRELVRHYTLSDADLAAIRRCRGDHNRLGYALMLCYLRFPAARCAPANDRRPRCWRSSPIRSVFFRTASTNIWSTDRNRQRHADEFQEQLGLRPFGTLAAAEVTAGVAARRRSRTIGSAFWREAVMQDAGTRHRPPVACRARAAVR